MKPPTILFLGIADNIHLLRWTSFFVRLGYEVDVATFSPGPIPGARIHDLGWRRAPFPLRYAAGHLKLRAVIRALHPDIVHVHYVAGYGILGAMTGFHPLFVTLWGSDIYRYPQRSGIRKLSVIHTLKKADLITGDSHDILKAACRLGGSPSRCRLIQWGVETERFRGLDKTRERERLSLPAGATLLLYTRGFGDALYRPRDILEAAVEILERHPSTRFVFLGDGPLRGATEERARSLGIAGSVIFTGTVPHDEIPSYLAAADAYVAVPESDATSVSMLEAMAAGLPIIASDLPSNREWITEGENGHLIRPGDRAGLARRALALMEDEGARRRMGEVNRAIVAGRADHRVNMEEMKDIYEGWVQRSR